MSKLRRKKPKVKMRSYGDGEKIPVVKSGGDFYLADQKYDNLGHGEFSGQTTGKLEGPSKRAIKGKGKKSANVRVTNEGGDPIFLQDTSSMKMKNDYSSMKSMGQAVAKWTSPHSSLMQKGEPLEKVERRGNEDSLIGQKSDMIKPDFRGEEEYKKEKINKAQKDAAAKKKEIAEKKTKRREKATDITQGIGRVMAAAGGTTVKTPSKSAQEKGQEKRDKEKKDKDKEKVKDSSQQGLENLDLGKKNK